MANNGEMVITFMLRVLELIEIGELEEVEQLVESLPVFPQLKDALKSLIDNTIRQNMITNNVQMNDLSFMKQIFISLRQDELTDVEQLKRNDVVTVDKLNAAVQCAIKINDIKEKCEKMHMALENLMNEKDLLEEKNKKIVQQNNRIVKQNQLLKGQQKNNSQCETLRQEIGSVKQENKRLKEEKNKIKDQIDRERQNSKRANAILKNNNEEYLQSKNILQNENDKLKEQLQNVKNQLLDLSQISKSSKISQSEKYSLILQQKQQKNEQIKKLQQILKKSEKQKQNLKMMMNEEIIKYKQQLQNVESKLEVEKQQIRSKIQSEFNQKSMMKSIIISDSEQILNYLAGSLSINETKVQNLVNRLTDKLGPLKFTPLYKYSTHKSLKIHDVIDNRQNILLICITQEDKIVGGYSSAGFSLRSESMYTKAFLFNSKGDEVETYPLKEGKNSVTYDTDYILFGDEDICLQKNSLELTSRQVYGVERSLHYKVNDNRNFLKENKSFQNESKVILKDYEFIQLKF